MCLNPDRDKHLLSFWVHQVFGNIVGSGSAINLRVTENEETQCLKSSSIHSSVTEHGKEKYIYKYW